MKSIQLLLPLSLWFCYFFASFIVFSRFTWCVFFFSSIKFFFTFIFIIPFPISFRSSLLASPILHLIYSYFFFSSSSLLSSTTCSNHLSTLSPLSYFTLTRSFPAFSFFLPLLSFTSFLERATRIHSASKYETRLEFQRRWGIRDLEALEASLWIAA